LNKQQILYVEDNPANMRLVEQLLKTFPDVELAGAVTAEIGLEMAQENRPDMVLMDINLPGMNGYEALAELKKIDSTRDVPVVAISANALSADIQAGLDAGFSDYLTKPINLQAFFATVKRYLNNNNE